MLEPRVGARAALLEHCGKSFAVGSQRFEPGTFGGRQFASQPDPLNRNSLPGFFVEAERAGAARHRRKQLHAVDYATNQCDVAVEVTWRLADHGIELAAVA